MKKHLFKFALTLFVCMLSNAALADENYLVNEDFSTFPIESGWITSSKIVKDWEIYRCGIYTATSSKVLKLDASNLYESYARTPSLGYAGDVKLSFMYGRSSSSEQHVSLYMNILNGGKFKDNNSSSKEISDINYYANGFTLGEAYIVEATSDTRIEFRGKYGQFYYVDDVKVIKLGEITLNEGINSSEAIAVNAETSCKVYTVRTLKANIWNTLCLPFDVNMSILETALGTGKNIELRTYSNYDATNRVMNFEVADNSTIEAGTPFLIKLNTLNTDNTKNTYEFTGVTIKNVAAKTIESNGVSFVGTYSPVELNTDGTHIFITTDNKIAKPLEGKNEMKGLRAYITVPSGFDFNAARLFLDDEATAINNIGTQKATNSVTLFNLQGQRVEHPRSGLYIKNNKLTIIR